MSTPRYTTATGVAVILIATCGLVGGYAGMFTARRDGFFDAVKACIAPDKSSGATPLKCLLDMSHAQGITHTGPFTHIEPIDSLLGVLLEFFAQGLKSDPSRDGIHLESLLAGSYTVTQFGAAWMLMAMEGLRKGNLGTVLSYTGAFGLAFQIVTITIIAPIYLVIHLLSTPVATSLQSILIDGADLDVLPWATFVSFVLPTALLGLPLLSAGSSASRYIAIAIWQPFPLYQSIVQPLFRALAVQRSGAQAPLLADDYKLALRKPYVFALVLAMGTHLLVVATVLVSHITELHSPISLAQLLLPEPLLQPATLVLAGGHPISSAAAKRIVLSFLQWDVYCTCAAFVTWAAILLYRTNKGRGLFGIVMKTIVWSVLGGPIAPAIVMLWERDLGLLKEQGALPMNKKKNS